MVRVEGVSVVLLVRSAYNGACSFVPTESLSWLLRTPDEFLDFLELHLGLKVRYQKWKNDNLFGRKVLFRLNKSQRNEPESF